MLGSLSFLSYVGKVSPERARIIVRDIAAGSRTHLRFFVLLITASLVASFGLIANSAAVIIGAMLVSPLMTPIFGVALAMLRGNTKLLSRALSSEILGVILAVGSAYLVGIFDLTSGQATPEMLSRTQPNLVDLLVAVFAGFAGTYALVDERVSPALPGVAIATAIVPPLSTCGLCLALGAWTGAGGAMLLFLANFVAILMVAIVTFWAAGLSRKRSRSIRQIIRHFGPALCMFVVVAIILTNSLRHIVREKALEIEIRRVLNERMGAIPGADLEDVLHSRIHDRVQVLAAVRSSRTLPPSWVTAMKEELESGVGEEVDLVVRTTRARDVSAKGSSLVAHAPDMDGRMLTEISDNVASREFVATQVLREMFEEEPGFELTRVEYGELPPNKHVVVAYADAMRRLAPEEILIIQRRLRDRMNISDLQFYFRVNSASVQDARGPVRVEWTDTITAPDKQKALMPQISAILHQQLAADPELIPIRTHFQWSGDHWRTLTEVVGSHLISAEDTAAIQGLLQQDVQQNVEVLIWYRGDYVATAEGLTTYQEVTAQQLLRKREALHELFQPEGNAFLFDTPKSVQEVVAN